MMPGNQYRHWFETPVDRCRSTPQVRGKQPSRRQSIPCKQILYTRILHTAASDRCRRIQSISSRTSRGWRYGDCICQLSAEPALFALVYQRRTIGMDKASIFTNVGEQRFIPTTSICFFHQRHAHQHFSATLSHWSRVPPKRSYSNLMTTKAGSQARFTQKVQHNWHVLPDGTKLEVLTQKCDDVRHF